LEFEFCGDSIVLMHLLKPLNNILGFKIENQLRIKRKTHFYNIRGQIVIYKNSEIGSANKLSFPCSNNQQKIRCKLLTMQLFKFLSKYNFKTKNQTVHLENTTSIQG
jgi:hypothetical protein